MVHFILGGAGCGKSTRLTQCIAQSAAAGAAVFSIVPEQFSFAFDARLYGALGAARYNGLESVSFTSLARMLFREYGGRAGTYADEMTKAVLLQEAIDTLGKRGALPYYARQLSGKTFPEAVGKVITELRRGGISPERFAEQTTAMGDRLREKAADIALIYAEYDRALRERDLKDSLTDITEAAALAAGTERFCGAHVFLDEFESFTGDQLAFLEVLFSQAAEVFVTLRTAAPDAPAFSVFDTPNATLRQLRRLADELHLCAETELCQTPHRFVHSDLAHLSASVLRPVRKPAGDALHVTLVEAKNCYTEVDYVCAEICRLVAEAGVRYREIALVTHQLSEYAGILEAAFARYEIPCHLDGGHGVMHTAVMQLVQAVLTLASARTPDTEDVLRYAKTPLLGIRCERTARLEQYCYTWNVEGESWCSPFPVTEKEADIEELRVQLIDPLLAFKRRCKGATGRELCAALYAFLCELEVPRNISGVARTYRDAGCENAAAALKALWGSLMEVLDTLADTLGDAPVSVSHFRDLCLSLLSTVQYATPPQLLDCVVLSPAETARLDAPRYTFVIGVNDGFFPSDVRTGGLLSDADKLELASAGMAVSRPVEQLMADERLIAYKTLSSASEGLYLCYPLADETGAARKPSPLIHELQEIFPSLSITYPERLSPLFYAATPQAAYHRYAEGDDPPSPVRESIREALCADSVYGPRLAALTQRGDVPMQALARPERLRTLLGSRLYLSSTQAEQYMLCPFSYFSQRVLSLSQPEKKELNDLQIGNLVHFCLERVLGENLSRDAFLAMSPEELTQQCTAAAAQFLTETMGGDFGKDARFSGNFTRLTAGIPLVLTHLQAELRQSKFRPTALELEISGRDGDRPLCLTASNGVELVFSGKIDRVDVYEENGERYIRVIDYKTGKKQFSLGHLLYGLDLQMLLYLFALTGKGGRYPDAKPAGVLYMPAAEPECARERDAGAVDAYLNKHFVMNGVLLQRRNVLNAMEAGLAGVYIPAVPAEDDNGGAVPSLKKTSSGFLTEEAFGRLRRHVFDTLGEMGERLFAGEIGAEPLSVDGKLPCRYCACGDVCGNGGGEHCRMYDKTAAEQMERKLTEEGAMDDGTVDRGAACGD